MTEDDRAEFARALFVLGETFHEPISDLRAEGYFDAMSDFTLEAAEAAIRAALKTCRFFPRPVELREMVQGDPESNADSAWAEVIRMVQHVGYTRHPIFADSRTMLAVQAVWGSWVRLCETLPAEGPELVGWMKQFKSAHKSHDVRQRVDALSAGMPSGIKDMLADIAKRKQIPSGRIYLTRADADPDDNHNDE